MNYARWSRRAAGYLIDWTVAAVPAAVGNVLQLLLQNDNGKATASGQLANALFGLVSFGIVLYNRWIRSGRTGQTWGRQALGIRLVDQRTRRPIGGGRAFVRDICHILDSIAFCVGWLFPLWDARRQTFADKIAGTVVIDQV